MLDLWKPLFAFVFATAIGCRAEPAAPPPDVVVITLDTLRADHVGAWGHEAAQTPWIDAIAGHGVRFSRATTVTNNTLPSHVSMFTGRHPQAAGVPRNGHKLPADVAWLPELLRGAGYETAAFVSASALSSKLGLDRGFDLFSDRFDVKEMDQRQRRAATTIAAASAWLDRPHEEPVFLWVHLFDPHYPYTPPAPFDGNPGGYVGQADGSMEYLLGVWGRMGRPKISTTEADRRRLVELYDGEIAYLDSELGRLLTAAQARDALVVLVADHGESLTEHGYLFDHGEHLFQPTLHVPLVVRAPATWTVEPGVSEALAQTIDIMPTVLSAARVAIPEGVDGHDLLPIVRGAGSGALRDVAFAESCRPWAIEKEHEGEYQNLYKAQSALRWPYKLIATPHRDRVELYDLAEDPAETTDIASLHPGVVDSLASELERWRGGELRIGRPDADNMEAIKELGYIER